MKKFIKSFLLVVISMVCILAVLEVSSNKKRSVSAFDNDKENQNKVKILIDPGHGGIDGGAVSKAKTIEKDIDLQIGLKLRDKLAHNGYEIIMTRDEDKGLYSENGTIRKKKIEDLKNRCKLKEETNCDMFISIHLNMFPESKYHGAQVWYSKNEESQKFAHILQQNLINELDTTNNRKEKSAKDLYRVLNCKNDIPSVIIECGFLSNIEEEKKLIDPVYQDKIAEIIFKSIKTYFSEVKLE